MVFSEDDLYILRSHKKFVLTTHVSADGDGIGSQLALARGLKSNGCDVAIVNPTQVPENLGFLLKNPKEIVTPRELSDPRACFSGALTVVLDMGAFDRLGAVLPYARQSDGLLVVDHHRMDKARGVFYLLDEKACATGEVTARILDALGIPLTLEIAEPLYAAIQTDTGGFRYPGTTPETHRLAARLLECGVDPQKIYTELFERQSALRLRLTGEILTTLQTSPGGKVAWIQVRRTILDKVSAQMDDADDMVNFTLQLDGVVAGFYFKELDTGCTKVSCRSRGDFAIDEFVGKWGGGGHHHAAGVRLSMTIDPAIELVVGAATEALEPR